MISSRGIFRLVLLVSGALLLLAQFAYAIEDETVEPFNKQPRPSVEKRLIQRNIEISDWFDSVANGLDLFMVGRRLTKEKNKTRVTLENTTYTFEGQGPVNRTSVGIYPRFPNLEKFLALKFTSYDEKENQRKSIQSYYDPNSRKENYGATVAWYQRFGGIRTSFEPRIDLQNKLKVSHSLAFDTYARFKNVEIKPKFEMYASATRGPGLYQGLNWNFILGRRWNLTFLNEGDYTDRIRTYNVNNGIVLGQILSDSETLAYSWIFNSNNRSNYHLENYILSVSWNRIIYKRVLDFTLTPYWRFDRSNNFKGKSGAVFNLRVIF